MRRLIHLYPGDAGPRRELLERQAAWLHESGIELILADERVDDSDRALYADAIELPPEERPDAAARAIVEWARRHRVDGILVQTEAALPAGALALRALSLPGPSVEAALRCVGKHLTRATLAAADHPQPHFLVTSGANDASDVRRFAADHGFPLMLKAAASTMARLVTKVDGDLEIESAVARLKAGLAASKDVARFHELARHARLDPQIDATKSFLVESFAAGAPVETDGFVVSGRARCFGALEQVMTPPPRFYVEGYLLPADRSAADAARIRATGERAAELLGLDGGGFSVELREDGRAARVIEVNGRLGEDEGLRLLFERAIGADPFRISVALALGERPTYSPHDSPRHALAYACSFVEGKVERVPVADEVAALGADAAVAVKVGDAMHAPPHPDTFPHVAWALNSHPTSSRAAFSDARARVAQLRVAIRSTLEERLADDVRRGLTARPRALSCRWFYDEAGSRLFEQICATPEYYVTRAEDELLRDHAGAIVAELPAGVSLIELGSGSATKTRHLLDALARRGRLRRYVMVDISPSALDASARELVRDYPGLEVLPFTGEYEDGLARLDALAPPPRLVLWLGSNVGNLHREEAARFLASWRARLTRDDRLLIGIDLRKERSTLERAYDDAAGVTARFNLNLLARINEELQADFDLSAFKHRARWDETLGRIEMELESLKDQRVRIARLGLDVDLARGETIHTENSYKYSEAEIDALAAAAGLRVAGRWFDRARRFSETLLAPR